MFVVGVKVTLGLGVGVGVVVTIVVGDRLIVALVVGVWVEVLLRLPAKFLVWVVVTLVDDDANELGHVIVSVNAPVSPPPPSTTTRYRP